MATSLIPDGVIDNFKLSKKFVTMEQGILTTDSGGIYTAFTPTSDSVNNDVTLTNEAIGNVVLITSIVSNQPAVPVSTPKPIQTVDRNLIASNHYGVNVYNGLTYASSGKVATGSSVEANGVDDVVEIHYDYIFTGVESITTKIGDVIKVINASNWSTAISNRPFDENGIFISKRIEPLLTGTEFGYEPYFDYIEDYIPKHNPITLDNQSVVASKALLTQTSNATQIFTQELDYDSTAGDFGDTNEFDQLTSGTLTDLNGNTVQTKVLLKPSSIKLGE